MHPRNPYIKPLDFGSLADSFPPLKPFVSTSTARQHVIDFKNPQAQRALTQALLKKDFGLTLNIPEDRLCPPVPNRLNYILWIQDIFSTIPTATSGSAAKLHGLDIGTGATAIYPLLGCSLPGNQYWTFVGTEIDPVSCNYANHNVSSNNLTSRIEIYSINRLTSVEPDETRHDHILAPLLNDPTSRFDFTMCNPPFYGSTAEIKESARAKEGSPSGVKQTPSIFSPSCAYHGCFQACTGAETEMITPGGEESFVLRMIHESSREGVKTRCRWFTSMLGKLSSLGRVVAELRQLNIDNYIIAQFVQGETRRWAIGWSFEMDRLPDSLARPSGQSLVPFLPLPTTLRQPIAMLPCEAKTALSQVLTLIESVLYHFEERSGSEDTVPWMVMIEANKNTWSRSARRKRKREGSPVDQQPRPEVVVTPDLVETSQKGPVDTFAPESPPSLVCRVSLMPESQTNASVDVTLEAQWVKGDSRSMFEGFWSHVCRKLKDKEYYSNK